MKHQKKYRVHLRMYFAIISIATLCVTVSVRDEGIGIPAEKQSHIFDAFYQCEESHKKDGNGLGLSIVKRITELLSGSIECHSVEGKGTEILVKISGSNMENVGPDNERWES